MKSNGLTLGVLGGMGPAATAEFMSLMADKAPADYDQEHPRMIVFSKTETPDRTTFLLGKGPDPMQYLKDGLNSLQEWGADLLAVTCNTAHFFIDQFRDELKVPLIHIVEETIKKSASISSDGAWLTATLGTMRTGLYQSHAKRMGYDFFIPTEEMQVEIHDITDLVKGGRLEEAVRRYEIVVKELWRERKAPIVCACTELPVIYKLSSLDQNMYVSSLEALAEGALRELY